MNTTITQNDSVSDEYVQCANRLIDLMERHQLRQIDISEILTYSRHFRQAQVWDSKSKGS